MKALFFILLAALLMSALLGRVEDSRLYAIGLLLLFVASALFPTQKPNQP